MKKLSRSVKAISLALIFVVIFMFSACGREIISAYDIAVQNGFSGTEQEWLDSLKGGDGQDGINGQDGENAEGLDIYDVFNAYLEENPDADFTDFLSEFLTVQYESISDAVTKAICSTVSISASFQAKTGGSFSGGGTGVIYKLDKSTGIAFIITNYHVINSTDAKGTGFSNNVKVYLYGQEYTDYGISATVYGSSMKNDIAVLRVQNDRMKAEYLRAVDVTDSNNIRVGETAIVVGNANGEGISATCGIISVDSQNINMEMLDGSGSTNTLRAIRTDSAVNGGNSGGGIFNSDGQLIAIVDAKNVSEAIEGMGYGLPSNVAVGVAEAILNNNNKKFVLGITTTIDSVSASYSILTNSVEIIESIKVSEVTASSAAQGKLLANDIIKSVKLSGANELLITRSFYLSDYLYKARNEDVLTITVIRGGTEMQIDITVTEAKMTSL